MYINIIMFEAKVDEDDKFGLIRNVFIVILRNTFRHKDITNLIITRRCRQSVFDVLFI